MEDVGVRLDARRVRKLVIRALASRRELALKPELLRIEDVAAALRAETKLPIAAHADTK